MIENVPSMEAAYRQHARMLFRAFAKLALQGIVVQPMDAADVVHDFFLEKWTDLERTFDPALSAFPTFLYNRFVSFARPRILRLHRLRGMLVDPHDLTQLLDSSVATPDVEAASDVSRVVAALDRLERGEKQLIADWLTSEPFSERQLARERGVSRYRLRQLLVDAVGRLSLSFPSQSGHEDLDHAVAVVIWGDKLTVEEAAARLGVTLHQARNAYARNQSRITRSLMLTHSVQTRRVRGTFVSEDAMQALLGRIFGSAPIDSVEAEVTEYAPELVRFLVDCDESIAERWREIPADRTARVYEALARGAGGAEGLEGEISEDDPLFMAHADDLRSVARAFCEALVPALPNGLLSLLHACEQQLRVVPSETSERLRRTLDVTLGGMAAIAIAQFGLTPSLLVLAADAVSMLIERAVEAGHLPSSRKLVFTRTMTGERKSLLQVELLSDDKTGQALSRADFTAEICVVAGVEKQASEILLDWLVSSAPHVRSLFSGFAAQMAGESVVLKQIAGSRRAQTVDNLYERWSSPVRGQVSERKMEEEIRRSLRSRS